MSDMFPGASSIGDSITALFGGPQDAQASYYKASMQQLREVRLGSGQQNQGVRDMPSTNGQAASANSPQYGNEKNRVSATEDPQEVEARWTARLAKFAGIVSATGTKLGGL